LFNSDPKEKIMGNNVLAFPGTSPRWWNFFVKGWKFFVSKWSKFLYGDTKSGKTRFEEAEELCRKANAGDVSARSWINFSIDTEEEPLHYFLEKDPVTGIYSVTREGIFEATRPPRI
jgi:hypothetical protein